MSQERAETKQPSISHLREVSCAGGKIVAVRYDDGSGERMVTPYQEREWEMFMEKYGQQISAYEEMRGKFESVFPDEGRDGFRQPESKGFLSGALLPLAFLLLAAAAVWMLLIR